MNASRGSLPLARLEGAHKRAQAPGRRWTMQDMLPRLLIWRKGSRDKEPAQKARADASSRTKERDTHRESRGKWSEREQRQAGTEIRSDDQGH